MSLRIGLTGGIASGKSTVADLFARRGAPVVDMDAICRALIAPGGACTAAVLEAFKDLPSRDGAPDRHTLRARVFRDAAARTKLEAILHPAAFDALEARCLQHTEAAYCILVIPLLVETGAQHRVDRVLVVDCRRQTQLQRMQQRGLTGTLAENILAAQAQDAQRLAAADDCIDNNGTPARLDAQVEALHRRYLSAAQG